jgi:hypothetical protein
MVASALLGTWLVLGLAGGGADERPAIGARVGPLAFFDVRFTRRTLDDFGPRRAYVLWFTRIDCPLAPRYLPRLAELERRYRGRGVQFVAIDVGFDDTLVEIGAQALDHDVDFPFVKDDGLGSARACGASRAGEVVLVESAGNEKRLRYRGRVDDQYRVGGERASPGRADLAEALDELLGGKEVSVPETPAEGCPIGGPPAPREGLTYARDVAPILERRCAGCHRDGGDAPFALADWTDASDHAAGIGEVVELGRMPPWHASAAHGRFENARSLPADERRTLIDWARTGAKPGELPPAIPAAPTAPGGGASAAAADAAPAWRIGTPDLVLQTLTEMQLPADGIVPYQYSVLPFLFTADTWVEAVEIRPSNRRAMHHCNLAHVKLGEEFRTDNFVTGQVPGGDPLVLDPGTAVLVPAGSFLGLQIHYVTTGREETDRISVALRFPRMTVQKRMRHLECADLRFAIPPGAPSHPVRASHLFEKDAIGIGMYAHMHKRGRDMRFRATAPDGKDETLLLIPTYDFDWQASYRWFAGDRRFAAGTRIDCLAHFDNSPFNAWNPDPTATVRFGLQTEQEMMYGFLFYVDADEQLGLEVDPRTGRDAAAR